MTLPQVIRAEHRGGYRIQIVFNDGTEGTVDFRAFFRRFFLDGGTVVWPNGADVAPETLHDAVLATRASTTLQPTARVKARRRG